MLIEELQPYFEAQPAGYDEPATFYLTLNRTKAHCTWSAGYQDFRTLYVLLVVNDCDTLEEVAIRLNARLERYMRMHLKKPRTLHDSPKGDTVGDTNVTEGIAMSDTKTLTHGQKLVGVNFNPSQDSNVARLKELAAEQIDLLEKIHTDRLTQAADSKADYDTNTVHGEAIRRVMDAQMWTVKDATWRPENAVKPVDEQKQPGNDGNTADPLNQSQDKPQNDATA